MKYHGVAYFNQFSTIVNEIDTDDINEIHEFLWRHCGQDYDCTVENNITKTMTIYNSNEIFD